MLVGGGGWWGLAVGDAVIPGDGGGQQGRAGAVIELWVRALFFDFGE